MVSKLFLITLLVVGSLADVERLNPGAIVGKVEAAKKENESKGGNIPQQPPQQPAQPIQNQQPSTTTQATLYTSQGYIVRIMSPFQEKRAAIQPRQPQAPEPPKPAVSESPVYPIKKTDSITTVYQGQPARPTMTMEGPRSMTTTNVIQNTNKPPASGPANKNPTSTVKKDEDDEDEDEDNNNNGKGRGNEGDKKTTVQSGDPWGDFVFPTRGPRPNWMRNDGNGGSIASVYKLPCILFLLLLFLF